MKLKRYLLDSHVALWALTGNRRLSRTTWRVIHEEQVFVSAISIWELLAKHKLGKLRLPGPDFCGALRTAGAELLPFEPEHAEASAALLSAHPDPFDRMLIGTARAEQMIFLTRDSEILSLAPAVLGPLLQEA